MNIYPFEAKKMEAYTLNKLEGNKRIAMPDWTHNSIKHLKKVTITLLLLTLVTPAILAELPADGDFYTEYSSVGIAGDAGWSTEGNAALQVSTDKKAERTVACSG